MSSTIKSFSTNTILVMIYQFTTNTLIQTITAVAAVITILLLWKFKKSQEVKFLIYLEVFVAIWATTYALEFASPELNTKKFWSQISYFGIAFLPLSYFLFTTAFSQKNNILNKRNISLLLIIPLITLGMVLTNDKHHLVWSDVTFDAQHEMAIYHHGIWFWVFFAYAQLLIYTGLINLIHSIFRFTAFYKSHTSVLLIASFFPIIGNLIYVTNLNPYPGFDWTPVSFVLTGLIIAIGVFRYRIFDIIPLAKTKLFETMDDGAIVVNNEGIIEDCNPAVYRIFNRQKDSILREPFEKVFHDYKSLIHSVKNRLASTQLEINRDGLLLYYQILISPIQHNGSFSGNLLVFHDVTSLRKAEKELKITNKQLLEEIKKREKLIEELDTFAHTVAHDLRNTLGSIFSASEIMEEIIKQNDKNLLFELTNLINDSAGKSIQITHELLLLATTEKQHIERIKLNMKEIFGEAKKQLEDIIRKTGARIIEPETWPEAIGYAPWIEEVWTNYLSNAIKYGGTPPQIEVGFNKLHNGSILFWVKDNGNGITPDDQKKLFKNFVRLEPRRAEGYGLGLSIVKKIIEKLDGKIGVKSMGNGDGSMFYFTLPVVIPPDLISASSELKSINEITMN